MSFVVKVLFFAISNEAEPHCTLFKPLKETVIAVELVFDKSFVED